MVIVILSVSEESPYWGMFRNMRCFAVAQHDAPLRSLPL